jgi:hypothetical protein
MAACSDDEGGTTALGASAGMGGDDQGEAGGEANPRGGSPGAGGTGSDAGAGNSAGEAGSNSTSGVRERFALAMCHAFFSCAEARKDFIIDLLGDEESCVPFMLRAQEVDPDRREQLRLVESGGAIDVDEAAFETCLALSTACVGDSSLQHEACRRAIAGRLPAGQACRSSVECSPDTYCRIDDASAEDTCAGTCTARKPAESACDSSEECDSDGTYYRCEKPAGSTSGTCKKVTVVTERAVGDPCGTTAVATEAACSGKLWCTRGDSRCAEPIAPDEPCIDDHDVCERGYFCTGAEGAKTCQLITIAAEEGASCGPQMLALCDLTRGLECIDGKCQSIGDGGVGTHCGVDSLNCNVGLYCDRDLDSCQPRLKASAPCTVDRQCESGSCDATKLCAADYCGIR